MLYLTFLYVAFSVALIRAAVRAGASPLARAAILTGSAALVGLATSEAVRARSIGRGGVGGDGDGGGGGDTGGGGGGGALTPEGEERVEVVARPLAH